MQPTDPRASAWERAAECLADHVSTDRIERYTFDANAKGIDALALYNYNMVLAASLLGPLHMAEVVARNAMHNALQQRFEAEDWWTSGRIALPGYHRSCIEEAEKQLRREFDRQASGRQVVAADVVAALEFGFWTGLLRSGPDGYSFERELWQPALQYAFPHNRRPMHDFRKLLDRVRRLRNRVTHHEPLYRQTHKTQHRYNDALLVIGSVSPPLREWIKGSSRVSELLATPATEYAQLRT